MQPVGYPLPAQPATPYRWYDHYVEYERVEQYGPRAAAPACEPAPYQRDEFRRDSFADRPLYQVTQRMGDQVEDFPPNALMMPVAFAIDTVDLVTRPIQGLIGAIFGE